MTFVEGEEHSLLDEHGIKRHARVVERDGGWYLLSEDGAYCWPIVSLWYWRALSQAHHWEGVADTQRGRVQVVGVGAAGVLARVEWLMADPAMLLIDIRYAARSRWFPSWNKQRLRERWGSRYTHERGLSNANYRDRGQQVALVDADGGVRGAVDLLSKGYHLLLLCGCGGDDRGCHCWVVLRVLEDRLAGLR